MNILKNMEAIFLAALVLAGATSYASAAIPAIRAGHADHGTHVTLTQTAVDGQPMQVVTVSAKRLSAAEKDRM